MSYKEKRPASAQGAGKKIAAVASSLVLVGSSVPAQVLSAIAPQVAWATDNTNKIASQTGLIRLYVSFNNVDGDSSVVVPTSPVPFIMDSNSLEPESLADLPFAVQPGYGGVLTLSAKSGNSTTSPDTSRTNIGTAVGALDAGALVPGVVEGEYTLDVNVTRAAKLTKFEGEESIPVDNLTTWGSYAYEGRTLTLAADALAKNRQPTEVLSTLAALQTAFTSKTSVSLGTCPGYALSLGGSPAASATFVPNGQTVTVSAAITNNNDGVAGNVVTYSKDKTAASGVASYNYTNKVVLTPGEHPEGGKSIEPAELDGTPALKVTAEPGFIVKDREDATNAGNSITLSGAKTFDFGYAFMNSSGDVVETPAGLTGTLSYGLDTVTFKFPTGITAADVFSSVPDALTTSAFSSSLKPGFKVEVTPDGVGADAAKDSVTVSVYAALTLASATGDMNNNEIKAGVAVNTDNKYAYGTGTVTFATDSVTSLAWDGTRFTFGDWNKEKTNAQAKVLLRITPASESIGSDAVTGGYLHYFAPKVAGGDVTVEASSTGVSGNIKLAWSNSSSDGSSVQGYVGAVQPSENSDYKYFNVIAPYGYVIKGINKPTTVDAELWKWGETAFTDAKNNKYVSNSDTGAVLRVKSDADATITVTLTKALTKGTPSTSNKSTLFTGVDELKTAINANALGYGGHVLFQADSTLSNMGTTYTTLANYFDFTSYGTWAPTSPLALNALAGYRVTVAPTSTSSNILDPVVTVGRTLTYEEITSTNSTTGSQTKKLHSIASESAWTTGKELSESMVFQLGQNDADASTKKPWTITVPKGVTVKYTATSDGLGKLSFRAPKGHELDKTVAYQTGDSAKKITPGSNGWAEVALADVSASFVVKIATNRALTDKDGVKVTKPSGSGEYWFGDTKITLSAGTRIADGPDANGKTTFALTSGASGLSVVVGSAKQTVVGSSHTLNSIATDCSGITVTSGTTTFAYTATFKPASGTSYTRSYVTGVAASDFPEGTWETNGKKVKSKAELDALITKDGETIELTEVKVPNYKATYAYADGKTKTVDYTVGESKALEPGTWQTKDGKQITTKAELDALVTKDGDVIELTEVIPAVSYTVMYDDKAVAYEVGDSKAMEAGAWQLAGTLTRVTTKAQLEALVTKSGDTIELESSTSWLYTVKYGGGAETPMQVGVDAELAEGNWVVKDTSTKAVSKDVLDALVSHDGQVIELEEQKEDLNFTYMASFNGYNIVYVVGVDSTFPEYTEWKVEGSDVTVKTKAELDALITEDGQLVELTSDDTEGYAYIAVFNGNKVIYVVGVDSYFPMGEWTVNGTSQTVKTKAELDALITEEGQTVELSYEGTEGFSYVALFGENKFVYVVGMDSYFPEGSWKVTETGKVVKTKAELDALVTEEWQTIKLEAEVAPVELHEGWNDPDGDGSWCYVKNGEKVVNDWVWDGKGWYFMDSDGVMCSGWVDPKGDATWFYLSEKHNGSFGRMTTGWQFDGHAWYYLNDGVSKLVAVGGMLRSSAVPGGAVGADGRWIA